MTPTIARRRGELLLALALVVFGWVGVRAVLWEDLGYVDLHKFRPQPWEQGTATAELSSRQRIAAPSMFAASPSMPVPQMAPELPPPLVRPVPAPSTELPPSVLLPPPAVSPRLAGGHALLWLAAVSQLPRPEALLAAAEAHPGGAPAGVLAPRSSTSAQRRWSADAWALVRSGGGTVGVGALGGTYGASQAGAVLRYRLAPTSPHKPTAYVRVTAALNGSGEREAAAGLSIRPIPAIPVVVAGEGRVGRFGSDTLVRPALMVVTELAPFELPAGVCAEFYAQGGYVGGRAATAFADGQLRIDRRVASTGRLELRAGGGAWGGAQEGAERLDVGPSATLALTKGSAAARVAFDWRFRVAGEAAPASGPALTVSAGF